MKNVIEGRVKLSHVESVSFELWGHNIMSAIECSTLLTFLKADVSRINSKLSEGRYKSTKPIITTCIKIFALMVHAQLYTDNSFTYIV